MPAADPIEAGLDLVEAAGAAGVSLRLLGGVGVAVHCERADPALRRSFSDIDVVSEPRRQADVEHLFRSLGYEPRDSFNTVNGASRLLFDDVGRARHVDVFVGDFAMCHRVPLAGRLEADRRTVPLAELLLTKLQVVEINTKDLQDVTALVAEHGVGESDDEAFNAERLSTLLAADWGLYTTVARNLDRLDAFAADIPGVATDVRAATAALRALMEAAPKTRAWKLRARVGTRVRWYELPEEP
jgi:hypothetical protein